MKIRRGALSSSVAANALYPLTKTGALTVANLITDSTRLTGTQGDGVAYPDSSVGVWPAATNLCANGGATTNATGWESYPTGTVARTTSEYYFGAAGFQFTPAALNDIASYTVNVSSSTTYTAQIRLKTPDSSILFLVDEFTAGSAYVTGHYSGLSPTPNEWTYATITFTTDATTAKVNIGLQATASTSVFYFDGVQLEAGTIATPYIETNGGTASRSAGRIQMPASVLDETQMWVAIRSKVPAAYDNDYATDPGIFAFGDDSSNNLRLFRSNSGNVWVFRRQATSSTSANVALNEAAGDTATFIGAAKSSSVNLSINGATFASTGGTQYIPTVAATLADIGTDKGFFSGRESGHRIYWAACGLGTLTNADAALFHSWGNNDPLPHQFPTSAQLTFLARFNGDGTFYRYV